jgi:hypothetical protein
MISQADLQTIATVFGKTSDEISGAISQEGEVSLDLRLNGKVYSQSEIDNLTKANEDAYIEIGYKKVAQAMGLELEPGEKDAQKIADKLKTNVTTTLEEKYKNQTPTEELEKALQEKIAAENKANALLKTIEEKETAIEELSGNYTNLQNEITSNNINSEIKKYLKSPDKAGLTYDQQLALFKLDHNIDSSDNGFIPKNTKGEIILNSVGEAETLENVVKAWSDKQTFTKSRAGMGGGDRGGGNGSPKGLTHEQAMEYVKKQGMDPMNEGSKLYAEVTAQ